MYQPLADALRPQELSDVCGQQHILGENGLLRRIIESGSVPNMIFYGLHILNAAGEHIGTVQQRVLTFLPKFELYIGEQYYGCICKEFTFFTPRFTLECSDWEVNGSFMEWDYTIDSASRGCIATITKELFHWTDTYVIDVADPQDALGALMVVLAIDAEKCSRNN